MHITCMNFQPESLKTKLATKPPKLTPNTNRFQNHIWLPRIYDDESFNAAILLFILELSAMQ